MSKQLTHYDERDYRAIQRSDAFHNDANEALFFARQLEYVKGQAYDVLRPAMSAMSLFPISTEVPAGASTITYRVYDQVGFAKIIANYSDDLPRVEVGGQEYTTPIRGLGDSYGYSMQEIRAAQMAQMNLDAMKVRAARDGHDQTINKLAWAGDAISGLPGFLTNPNLPAYVVPATGTGTSKTFASKTADQIIEDVNGLINSIVGLTKGVHRPNQVWLPLAQYTRMMSLRIPELNVTVMSFLRDNNPGVTFLPVVELTGAGAGGTDVMIALENNNRNFQMEIPMMFLQHAPQYRNLEFVVNCESRFGGVIIRYPLAFAVAAGI